MAKRAFDFLVSLALLLVLGPLMLMIALAIVLESGLPVLFRQRRIGRYCRAFTMYKFRSMVAASGFKGDAPPGLSHEELAGLRRQYVTSTPDDSRVTRVGAILRRIHMDELPQLFHVVVGQMSLVGPRPDVPVQQADYLPHRWEKRHAVRPGVTGFAQVCPDRLRSRAARLALDIYYVNHCSLCFDLVILFKTAWKVLRANSF